MTEATFVIRTAPDGKRSLQNTITPTSKILGKRLAGLPLGTKAEREVVARRFIADWQRNGTAPGHYPAGTRWSFEHGQTYDGKPCWSREGGAV